MADHEFGIETLYVTHETSQDPHGPGGSFLRTEFRHGDDRYDLRCYDRRQWSRHIRRRT